MGTADVEVFCSLSSSFSRLGSSGSLTP